jgi:anti-sigma regulatory factor (Ser/Thr protein kinase)
MAAAKVVTNEEESTVVSEEARYEVELPAVPPSVRIARRGVTRFATGLGVDVVNMTFAVSEAVANVVLHAYRGDADGPVRINALAAEDEVRVIVADQGVGLRPDPGLPWSWSRPLPDRVGCRSRGRGFVAIRHGDRDDVRPALTPGGRSS